MNDKKEKDDSSLILPLVILLIFAVIAAAAVFSAAYFAKTTVPTPDVPPETLPVGTGAGIIVNIPQSKRPRLSEAAYENPETGLFTETGIADFVIPSQKSIAVYRENPNIIATFGTATVISEDGFLLTCAHVIDKSTAVTVLVDGDYITAEIIAAMPESDLALLKIEAAGLVPVMFGESGDVVLGEKVVCASAAGRYPDTLTFGNVSNLKRNVKNGFIKDDSVGMMQVSCFINPGGSGAPVFNMYGQCIGIADSKLHGDGYEGIGFIINADDAVAAAEQMMSKAEKYPENAETQAFSGGEPNGGEGFFISDTALNQ
ncbi:MAG: serine protease [Ruminococcus sp.]|jgi:S1-C subfamily serine protease|nr:serine protease [Ruminococcus sp.]